jgi:CO/xanthine dehydrogenase FAD-binding subunit
VVALHVPRPAGPATYAKAGARNAMARAVCGVAVRLDVARQSVRVCLVGVGPRAIVATLPWDADGDVEVPGISDRRGSAAYRRRIASVLTRRALQRAREELPAWS